MRIVSTIAPTLPENTRVSLVCSGPVIQVIHEEQVVETIPSLPYANLFARRLTFNGLIKPDGIMPIRYAGLHQHSWFSLLDGLISPKKMAEVAEYESALTDHGNMFGYFTFYKAMKAQGKKPILGFEAYVESMDGRMDANHLVLLAENSTGLENLVKLNSLAWENVYNRPQVKWEWLEQYAEGVICLTACLGGEIPRAFSGLKARRGLPPREPNPQHAVTVLNELLRIFGHNNVFIEIQRHGDDAEAIVNPGLEWLSAQTGVPIVATTDSHYGKAEDAYIHEIQLCMQTGAKFSDPNRFKFKGTGFHMMTSDEMEELFADHPEWLDTTLDIADRCNVEIETGNYKLPVFDIPPTFADQNAYLEHCCWQGFEERFAGTPHFNNPEYRERLSFELDVIKGMGFPGYFLIVADFINWAKNRGILVGPGRGSACGSMVAYVMRITDADPIEYQLLFERFLNPDRVSMPDIDVDFQDDRREEVIDYVKEKYGIEAVSRIVTFGTLAAKAAIKDVARVLIEDDPNSKVSLSAAIGNKITKTIPSKPGTTLKKAMAESVEFKALYDTDPQCREIIDIAFQVEGLPRHTGSHACFEANTLVTTNKGLKRIADIQVGDEVLTHKNRFKPVVQMMVTPTETVYTLKSLASFPIEVTGNHPMYVREVLDLKEEKLTEPSWRKVEQLEKDRYYLGVPINQESTYPSVNGLKLPFEKDEFWALIGQFARLGDLSSPYFNLKSFVAEDQLLLKSRLKQFGIAFEAQENCISLLPGDFSTYLTKQLNLSNFLMTDVLNLPKSAIRAFLTGYIDEKISYFKLRDYYKFIFADKDLAIAMSSLLHKACEMPTRLDVNKGYVVTLFLKPTKNQRSFYEDGYIWTKVSHLTSKQSSKEMYNLTVLDDSSYTVHGVAAHNCGIIIADRAISDYVPTFQTKNPKTGLKETTCQVTMGEAEELGMLKVDFLGLRTLGVISEALDLINKRPDVVNKVDFNHIPMEDVATYDFLSKGNTAGVFQLESAGMTGLMRDLYQDASTRGADYGREMFERLVAGLSLYRPGPMDEIPNYIQYMKNPNSITYPVPALKEFLDSTYSVITYQEQVMFIVRELAGFTKGQADYIRKSMGRANMPKAPLIRED